MKRNIFLVHGWGGTKNSLQELSKLIQQGDTVYLLDLPGFGEAPNPPADWGPYEYAEYVSKWIAKKSKENSKKDSENIYIGHSFGGGIGVTLADTKPDLIDKLILMSSAIYRNPKVDPTIKKLQKLPFYKSTKNSLKGMKKLIYRTVFKNSDSHKFEELESNYRKIISTDLSHHLPNINQPTLILWGDEDVDTPVDEARKLNQMIHNSEVKLYKGFTHGLPKNNPEIIAEDVINFINQEK
jgi:pimeloyl-ACP methyl ester carboxylesterase